MTKVKLTKADREALKARGFIEGQPDTIPENISPVLKSQLLAEMGENGSGTTPGEAGGPEALAQRQNRQQNAMADDDGRGKVDDATGRGKK